MTLLRSARGVNARHAVARLQKMRLTLEQRRAFGRAARASVSRSTFAKWEPADRREDPVALLSMQNATRQASLVPVRHGRMMVSPFAFYRGAAKIMANDLTRLPRSGLVVQLCGDAHLANFGLYASPERTLLFDVNDFDETLPGPFELDVARLATSFVIAARDNALTASEARDAARASVTAYREAMAGLAREGTLAIWYSRLDAHAVLAELEAAGASARETKEGRRALARARTRGSESAVAKLTEVVDGQQRFIHAPPLIIPSRELIHLFGQSVRANQQRVVNALRGYSQSLAPDRRVLLDRFELVDIALRAVGVGSVGTFAWVVLMHGRDAQDPLVMQGKQAMSSVLEGSLPKSVYREPGERVVQGQLLMQAASDVFLGWAPTGPAGRSYYFRQLRDMKASLPVERFGARRLAWYAELCGWTLARAHARSGDPVAIAAYLGNSDRFDRAMTQLAERYADQNERDYAAFIVAIRGGRIEAIEGL